MQRLARDLIVYTRIGDLPDEQIGESKTNLAVDCRL
jgi:hypothetical protein